MVTISRIGADIQVHVSETEEAKYVERVEMVYKAAPAIDRIAIKIKRLDGSFDNLEPKVGDLTLGGVVVTDKGIFDTQYPLVFFDTDNSSGGSVVGSVGSIAEMIAYAGDSNFIVVLGGVDYGMFAATDAVLVNDGGTIYPRALGGHWLRQFNKANGVTPSWWAAQGDGVTDDIDALDSTVVYAMKHNLRIVFGHGIYRVTRQWLIGDAWISSLDATIYSDISLAPSFNPDIIDPNKRAVHISGTKHTVIYGDFTAIERTAIVYYSISGSHTPNVFGGTIQDITIAGQGTYTGTVKNDFHDPQLSKNQMGLVINHGYNFTTRNLGFENINLGLCGNNCYFSHIENTVYNYCGYGLWGIAHNACVITNSIANFCIVGHTPIGGSLTMNGIYSEYSKTALDLSHAGRVAVNGAYFENDVQDTDEYQLIIGIPATDPEYDGGATAPAIDINAAAITVKEFIGGVETWKNAILINEGAGKVTLSNMVSNGTNTFNAGPSSQVFGYNLDVFAFGGTGKVYEQGISANFKDAIAEKFRVKDINTPPGNATDTGTYGEIRFTNDYIYVCIATNTWVRSPLVTW